MSDESSASDCDEAIYSQIFYNSAFKASTNPEMYFAVDKDKGRMASVQPNNYPVGDAQGRSIRKRPEEPKLYSYFGKLGGENIDFDLSRQIKIGASTDNIFCPVLLCMNCPICCHTEQQRKSLLKFATHLKEDVVNCCRFCKKDGQKAEVYLSHVVRNEDGSLTCPILRSHVCPVCKATGDNAHTFKYCTGRRDKKQYFRPR